MKSTPNPKHYHLSGDLTVSYSAFTTKRGCHVKVCDCSNKICHSRNSLICAWHEGFQCLSRYPKKI